MAVVSGVAYIKNVNKLVIIDPRSVQNLNITLPKSMVYRISFDQSSSCTGIFIKSTNGDFYMMVEVKRDSDDKILFYRDLKTLIYKLIHGVKVDLAIIEEPVPNMKQYTSGKILLELKGKLTEWLSEFGVGKLQNIYPQTWKKYVVSKKKALKEGDTLKK